MIELPGWSAVGPPVPAPGGHLQVVADRSGVHHRAIVFRSDLADHPMLREGFDPLQAFLQRPGVAGLAPLAAWDRERATFVYPMRDGVLLATLLEQARGTGRPAGARAALELLALVAPILEDAVRAGRRVGLNAHGGLDPWRIQVHPTGEPVTLLGHGVAPVHITSWLDEETDEAPGIGLRYYPPERIEEQDEDLRADLYALATLAAELLLGEPLIAEVGEAAVDPILSGAAQKAVEARIPGEVGALLAKACARDPRARFGSGKALGERAANLARQQEGPGLVALVTELAAPPAPPAARRKRRAAPPQRDPLDEDTNISFAMPTSGASLRLADDPPADDHDDLGDLVPVPLGRHDMATDDTVVLPDLDQIPSLGALGSFPTHANLDDQSDRTDVIGVPREVVEALLAREANAAPQPVPELAPDASLPHIQEHARRIVDRTADLAARALAMSTRIAERAKGDDSQTTVVRAAQQAAERARRAAESAKSAANLLALDDDAAGAMITLDLVRNAELQCDGALADVTVQHRELERVAERVQAQARALQESARRAAEYADAATDAANQADDLLVVLEQEQREGLLTAQGTGEAIDAAVGSAERAHAAAEEARAHAEQAGQADRADLATRYAELARRAEESALAGLQETREAAERARRMEASARQVATTRTADAAAAARLHAEEAWRSLQRADEALKHAATPQSKNLRDECARHVRDAEAATAEADRALQSARGTEQASEAERLAVQADAARGRAEEAAHHAAAASDRVVRTAGALAERRARVSKLQEEARGLVERSRTSTARARDEVDRLLDDTSRLAGGTTTQWRTEAVEAVQRTEAAMVRLDELARQVASATDIAPVEALLPTVRQQATEVARLADMARDGVSRAREESEAELVEVQRKEEARREVAKAAQQADAAANRCRELVDQAWGRTRGLPAPLPGAGELDAVVELKNRAMEIIDIAEFQAGEAAASADMAGQESDPGEARGHAQTASSFLERITADLPEAIELLERAEQLALKENEAVTAARARTTELAATVDQIVVEASNAVEAGRRESGDWVSTPAVAQILGDLEQALGGFDEDQTEAGWAKDQCSRASTGDDAQEFVPSSESAVSRARDRRRRIDAQLELLRRAVASSEAAAGAVQEARRNTRGALDALGSDLSRVVSAEQRLKDAIARHGATAGNDLEVANAELRMRESVGTIRRIRHDLEALVDQAELAQEPEEARNLAARALELRVEAELAVEQAAETEVRGAAAAEKAARARVEAERRQLEAAREAAADQARRARDAVERIDTALDEAEEESAATTSDEARLRFEEAVRLGERLRTVVIDVDRAQEEARAAQLVASASAAAEKAKALADRVVAEAARAGQIVQEARDLARAAAAEVQALQSVRDQIRSMASSADDAVERARDESLRILQLLRQAPRSELRSLSEQANGAVQTASTATAKVKAALPLAEQAEQLAVAEAILRTARQALERALGAADTARDLVEQATEHIRQEKETAARALDEARAEAARPLQDAKAAVAKADTWNETARREWQDAGRPEGARSLIAILEKATREVRTRSDAAAERARAASEAPTQEQAEMLGRQVRTAVDEVLGAARNARTTLDELREQLQRLRAEQDSLAQLVSEAEDHAAAASQVADQAEATLRELESAAEDLGDDAGDAVDQSLLTVRTSATNARFAAASAGGLVDRVRTAKSRADAEKAVEEAHRSLEDALDALEKVVAAEVSCRGAIQVRRQASRDAEERRREEERRVREESARYTAELEMQRVQDEDRERRRRDDERRARFERRREERLARTTPAPAGDRDAMRQLLRQNRPTSGGPSGARPRRLGESPGRRESMQPADERVAAPPPPPADDTGPTFALGGEETGGNTTDRKVRSWTPSRGASGPATGAIPRRARAERPSAVPGSSAPPPSAPPPRPPRGQLAEEVTDPGDGVVGLESGKVDALLERLRRRSERD